MPNKLAGPWRRIATVCLSASIAGSTLAAGGWKLEVLPFVAALALVAFIAAVVGTTRGRARVQIPYVVIGLLALALLTVGQAITLPAGLLAGVSPKAAEVRAFIVGDGAGPLSYEPAASLREVSKLILYALVVWTAFLLGGRSTSRVVVFQTIVVVGLISAAIAIIHRVLGIERLFGLMETAVPTKQMLTTFVNPNHAAGFMALCAATGLGLGEASSDRAGRIGWWAAAAVCAVVSVGLLSKGGLAGLLLALVLYVSVRRWDWLRAPRLAIPIVVGVGVLAAGLWSAFKDTLLDEHHPWQVGVKLAAVQDVLPLIWDHPITGIGRGAFVSVYPQYKTSPLQLTFAFPENLAAQLFAEWGLPVGLAVLVGLVLVVARRLRGDDPAFIGAMAGVAAVVVQNLVDFSLELAGMAVSVAAIIGTCTSGGAAWSLPADRRPTTLAVVVAATVGLFGSLWLAFAAGDLDLDLKRLNRMVQRAQANEPTQGHEALWARHPANPLVSAQVAYLLEVQDPPDYAGALKAANRTLYLAPTYADGHLLTGRLLMRTGFRQQGLLSIRRAWEIGGARLELTNYALRLCRTVDDVWALLPRADLLTDRPDGRALGRAARQLIAQDRAALARALLSRPFDDAAANDAELAALTAARHQAGLFERSLSAVRIRRKARAHDDDLAIVEARTLLRLGRTKEALTVLAGARQRPNADFQLLRFKVALSAADLETAADALDQLKRRPESMERKLVRLEADLQLAKGDVDEALATLNRSLEQNPTQVELRAFRAKLLLEKGRRNEAKLDLLLVLRRNPDHRAARTMAKTLGIELPADSPAP